MTWIRIDPDSVAEGARQAHLDLSEAASAIGRLIALANAPGLGQASGLVASEISAGVARIDRQFGSWSEELENLMNRTRNLVEQQQASAVVGAAATEWKPLTPDHLALYEEHQRRIGADMTPADPANSRLAGTTSTNWMPLTPDQLTLYEEHQRRIGADMTPTAIAANNRVVGQIMSQQMPSFLDVVGRQGLNSAIWMANPGSNTYGGAGFKQVGTYGDVKLYSPEPYSPSYRGGPPP